MAIDRRQFLQLAAAAGLAGLNNASAQAEQPVPVLASAYKSKQSGAYGVAVCDASGRVLHSESLPGRGHAVCFRPGGEQLITFARRPGRFMQVLDLKAQQPTLQIGSLAERHFYGHGCFDAGARRLFCTENDFQNARGVIGVYDAQSQYVRRGEFPSYGVGPHEIILHPDGHTLVVANGGIETHPDYPREKLNIPEMRSSIAYIDSRDGKLIKQFYLPDPYQKLSLRHMAINQQGEVFFGGQYEGAAQDMPLLLGTVSLPSGLRMLPMARPLLASLKNYISSVCVVPGSDLFVASASRGGEALLCDAKQQTVLQVLHAADGSGVAASSQALYYSAGDGALRQYSQQSSGWQLQSTQREVDIQWDNHLSYYTA